MDDYRFTAREDFTNPHQRRNYHREVAGLVRNDPTLRNKLPVIASDARGMSKAEWRDARDAVTGQTRGGKKFETMPRDMAPRSSAYDLSELNERRRGLVNVSSDPARRPMDVSEYNARRMRGVR
jgi:hypothetical protein